MYMHMYLVYASVLDFGKHTFYLIFIQNNYYQLFYVSVFQNFYHHRLSCFLNFEFTEWQKKVQN